MLSLSSEAGRGSYNDLPESEKAQASSRFLLIKTTTVFLETIRFLSMGALRDWSSKFFSGYMPSSICISFKNPIRCKTTRRHLLSFYFWK